ncbi:MAG TPA: ABC transporter permease subunit [Streptosporangiaceae bacterium]|nr:ABC transporter permease subunit [Streptosporangiaceae bacterium]
MRADVTLFDLRLRRRSLLGYTAGMALYALVVVALYPQFKNSLSLNQLTKHGSAVAALFGATGTLTSPAGWLSANIYANFLPLIMLLITIGYGAACIAGQDEDGTLSLTSTLPLTRRSILLQKTASLAAQAVLLGAATMACAAAGRGFDLVVPAANLAGITIGVILASIDFGLLALAVGCWTGSRGTALGIASAAAAASYLISSLAPVVSWLGPARYASLLYWSTGNNQLTTGLPATSIAVLTAAGLTLLALAGLGFRRLDLH